MKILSLKINSSLFKLLIFLDGLYIKSGPKLQKDLLVFFLLSKKIK